MKLKDIAKVSSGATFRSRLEASPSGNIRVIQTRDLRDNTVLINRSVCINHREPKPDHLVKRGDIIFRPRGWINTAALVQEDVGDTIVADPLFRVRPDIQQVVPGFLLWWINQPSSRAYFLSRLKHTTVRMVGKSDLEDLKVNLPPLERQNKIAELFNLFAREQRLLQSVMRYKARYVQGILMRMASESRPTASNKTPGLDATTSTPGQTQPRTRS